MFEFEVEDSGPGIPAHLQERVFEPFVQGDIGLSKNFSGTGLGLSICSQLAKLMRGSISLESVEGTGSTFTLRIPLKYTESTENLARPDVAKRQTNAENDAGSLACLSGSCSHTHHALPSVPGVRASPLLAAIDRPASVANNEAGVVDTRAHARLVGLSAPFFVPSPSTSTADLNVAALEHAVVEASQNGDKVRVLVAEDNQVNQEVVLRMLKLEEIYDVSVARDGQEAYEMVKESMEQEKLFDLIFMDVQVRTPDFPVPTKVHQLTCETDAQSRRSPKHSHDPANGLSSTHRGFDGLRRGEQCRGL
jgi:osomolarity two-component system sensor histidine kinase SLN1